MSEDAWVNQLFSGCVELGAPLLAAKVSRSFLDLNREPFELDARMFADRLPSYMNTTSPRVLSGLGTVPKIVGENQNIYSAPLSLQDVLERIETIYRPYHRTLASLLDGAHRATGQVLLIDAHSMPSSAANVPGRFGTGTIDVALGDRHGSSCEPSIVEIAEQSLKSIGLNVQRNKPYAGGYITEINGKPRSGRHALQIEINRALYMDESTRKPNGGFQKIKEAIDYTLKNVCEAVMPWTSHSASGLAAE